MVANASVFGVLLIMLFLEFHFFLFLFFSSNIANLFSCIIPHPYFFHHYILLASVCQTFVYILMYKKRCVIIFFAVAICLTYCLAIYYFTIFFLISYYWLIYINDFCSRPQNHFLHTFTCTIFLFFTFSTLKSNCSVSIIMFSFGFGILPSKSIK